MLARRARLALVDVLRAVDALVAVRARAHVRAVDGARIADGARVARVRGASVVQMAQQSGFPYTRKQTGQSRMTDAIHYGFSARPRNQFRLWFERDDNQRF